MSCDTGIYAIVNILNNNVYIGSASCSFKRRFREHVNLLLSNKHHSKRLQYAWNKYGSANFEFKILEEVPNQEFIDKYYLTDVEQLYLDTYFPEYNMNPTAKSQLGFRHTEETKLKMSKTRTGTNNGFYGKTHTEEFKQAITIRCKGVPLSLEHKNKVRNALIKRGNSRGITYYIYCPDGSQIKINNLREFAKLNNLSRRMMEKLSIGEIAIYKGYSLIKEYKKS